MKLKKIAVLITAFVLSCNTLAGCGNKQADAVTEQVTEDESSAAADEADENVSAGTDTNATERPDDSDSDTENSCAEETGEENSEIADDKTNASSDEEIQKETAETVNEETADQKENRPGKGTDSSSDKEETKTPNKEDNKKTDGQEDKKPDKETGKKPNKEDGKKPDEEADKKQDKEDGNQSEAESSGSEENNKTDTISAVLAADFAANVNGAGNAKDLAGRIASDAKFSEYHLVVMPVEEGYLNGFDNEIRGFDEAAMFSPMIGTIPFVAYIFRSGDTDALVQTLKSNANLRWNICTAADEITVKTSGDYVLFAMTPASFH
ncbi:MAG: hypothetical protein PUD20_02055 [bacterium]|nr:hypothetical protein [bacterium]